MKRWKLCLHLHYTPWQYFDEFDGISCRGKVKACIRCGHRKRKIT